MDPVARTLYRAMLRVAQRADRTLPPIQQAPSALRFQQRLAAYAIPSAQRAQVTLAADYQPLWHKHMAGSAPAWRQNPEAGEGCGEGGWAALHRCTRRKATY